MFNKLFVIFTPFFLLGCIGADITSVQPVKYGYFLEGKTLYYQNTSGIKTVVAESCISSEFNFDSNKAKNLIQPTIELKEQFKTTSVLDNSHIVKTYRKLSNRLFVWKGVFVDASVLPLRVPFAIPYGTRKIDLGLTDNKLTSIEELTDVDGKSIGFFYGYLNEAGSSYYGAWFMRKHPAQKYPRDRFGIGVKGYSVYDLAKLYFECDWSVNSPKR